MSIPSDKRAAAPATTRRRASDVPAGLTSAEARIDLHPRTDAPAPLVFHRGAHAPYATRWFGVTSLAGHARNLVASTIAAESIDARDWMRAAPAEELLTHVVRALGGDATQPTLCQALGRPLWIDFVADTGDDHDVSQAVARMIFATYTAKNEPADGGGDAARGPSERTLGRLLPRGDVLLFGGDTAYPVATGEEIARRVVAPYNEVLRAQAGDDEPQRVLLGIPGNHDWYDGLDGFGRLFRRSPHATATSQDDGQVGPRRRRVRRRTGIVARQLHLDEVGGLMKMLSAAGAALRALWAGSKIVRPRRLALAGYEPVQECSYWALPLAPGLEAWGVDRQLGRLDYRQRLFFAERHRTATNSRILFIAPDPALAFGEPHEPGARMLSACRLSLERDRVFYLTGDMHHYERRSVAAEAPRDARSSREPRDPARASSGPPRASSLHVIAGGGGAFLHGTRIGPYPAGAPAHVWPSAATSRRLVAQVPFKLMIGSAGFILHIGFALVAAIELAASARGLGTLIVTACVVAAALATLLYVNVGHNRAHPRKVLAVAIPFGVVLGLLPMALRLALPLIVPILTADVGVVVVYAFLGALGMGFFLATIAVLGLEHQQAFSVLSHPGFKHFVRMCVHPDGRIEAWVIGKDDPLVAGSPVLVDRFDWPAP